MESKGVNGVQLVRIQRTSIGFYQQIVSNAKHTTTHTQPIERIKRPFSATFLTWMVLIITLLNWIRFIAVVRQWTFLQSLSPRPPILYLGIFGLIWGVLGALLVWGLILGSPWSPRFLKITAILYAAYYWLDRLVIADPSAISNRWPFAFSLTVILLSFTFWVLSRSKVQQFYNQPSS